MNTLVAVDWQVSPREVLATETIYPGLMDDLNVILWQRKLIEEQLKNAKTN